MSAYANILSQVISGTPIQKISMPASMRQKCSVLEMPFESSKPYDPVQGEFFEAYTDSGYCLKLEHVGCTVNPASEFEISGKDWKIKSNIIKPGVTQVGFNSIKISFPGETITFESNNYKLAYQYPGIKVDNLASRYRSGGFHGDLWILDHLSGARFDGKIVKPFKINGKLTFGNNVEMVSGCMKNGVYFTNGKRKWISPVGFEPLKILFREEVLQDPMFTRNVWKDVYECIDKENFEEAEKIRRKIEASHLAKADEGIDCFKSRYRS